MRGHISAKEGREGGGIKGSMTLFMFLYYRKHLYGLTGDVDLARSAKVEEREMVDKKEAEELELYPEDFLLFPLSVPSFSYMTIEQEKEEV